MKKDRMSIVGDPPFRFHSFSSSRWSRNAVPLVNVEQNGDVRFFRSLRRGREMNFCGETSTGLTFGYCRSTFRGMVYEQKPPC